MWEIILRVESTLFIIKKKLYFINSKYKKEKRQDVNTFSRQKKYIVHQNAAHM